MVSLSRAAVEAVTTEAVAPRHVLQHGKAPAAQPMDLVPTAELLSVAAPEDPDAAHKELYFRPVSTTIYCVMWLTILTLVVHTSLALSRSADEFGASDEPSRCSVVLANASRGAPFAPVMSLLFLGYRMFVLAQTRGLGEPQLWAKGIMVAATVGLTLQLVASLVAGACFMELKPKLDAVPQTRNADDEAAELPLVKLGPISGGYGCAKRCVQGIQYMGVLCTYGGICTIASCMLFTTGPVGEVSVAVSSAAQLAFLYFLTEFCRWVVYEFGNGGISPNADRQQTRSTTSRWPSFSRSSRRALDAPPEDNDPATRTGWATARAASLAACLPAKKTTMLSVLFLAARMRHIQINPPDGLPPPLVGTFFKIAAIGAYVEVLVSAYIGATGHEDVGYYQVPVFRASWGAHFIQHSSALASFVSSGVVVCSLWYHWFGQDTLLLSPTIRAELALVVLYNAVHALLWFGGVTRDLLDRQWPILMDTCHAALVSVGFSPLLCLLFVACRIHALQITNQKGSPEYWEQDCVMMCCGAVFIQLICCLLVPIFSGAACSVDKHGHSVYDLRPMVGAYAVTVVKYVALVGLHGGVVGICVAIFTMTPASCMAGRPDAGSMMLAAARSLAWAMVALLFALVLSSAKVVGLAVKFAIESLDTVMLGVQINVGKCVLNVSHGFVNINGLVVLNPDGKDFTTPFLVKVNTVVIKINMGRLFWSLGKDFELQELALDGVTLIFEKGCGAGPSNVKAAMEHLEKHAGHASSPKAPDTSSALLSMASTDAALPAKTSAPGIHVELGHVRIADIVAQVVHPSLGRLAAVELGTLDIDDMSKKAASGNGVANIATFLLATILKTALSNVGILGTLVGQGAKKVARKVATTCCRDRDL